MTDKDLAKYKKWAVPLKDPTEFSKDPVDDDIEKIKHENQVLRERIKNIEAENFGLTDRVKDLMFKNQDLREQIKSINAENEKLKEKQKSVLELMIKTVWDL